MALVNQHYYNVLQEQFLLSEGKIEYAGIEADHAFRYLSVAAPY